MGPGHFPKVRDKWRFSLFLVGKPACWLCLLVSSFTVPAQCLRPQSRWLDWGGSPEGSIPRKSFVCPPPSPHLLQPNLFSDRLSRGCYQTLISLCHFRHSIFLPGKTLLFGIVKCDSFWVLFLACWHVESF